MSDLQRYVAKRKMSDPEFAENYDEGYQATKRECIEVLRRLNKRQWNRPMK